MKKWIFAVLCLSLMISVFPTFGAEDNVLGRWLFYGSSTGVIYDISGKRQHMTLSRSEKGGYVLPERGSLATDIVGRRGITAAARFEGGKEADGVIFEVGNSENSVFKIEVKNGKIRVFVKPSQYDGSKTAEAVLPERDAEITVSVNVESGNIKIYADNDCIADKKIGRFVVNRFGEMSAGTTEKFGDGVKLTELLIMAGAVSPECLKRPENRSGLTVPVSMWNFDSVKDGIVEDVVGDCNGTAQGCEPEDEAVSGQSMRFLPEQSGEINFGSGITDQLRGKSGFTLSFWIQELVKIQRPNIVNLYMEDGLPGFQVAVGNTQIQVRIRS